MSSAGQPRVVLLAGGLGTRLQEETTSRPKPMVEIGGWPMLWHIMKLYAAHGYEDFVVALGYKGSMIKSYFRDYAMLTSDLTVDLQTGEIETHERHRETWRVTLAGTGEQTQTGGRLKRLRPYLGMGTFMMTYGDGIGDIDIRSLMSFHRSHGRLATVTAVRPPARFGGLDFDGDAVQRFVEKPQLGEGWINGGFFVLEPGVLEYIDGDDTVFEGAPLERLVDEGQLMAYRHEGFWQSMDTLRDVRYLEELWTSGSRPWKVWADDDE